MSYFSYYSKVSAIFCPFVYLNKNEDNALKTPSTPKMYMNEPGSRPSINGLIIPPILANTLAIPKTVPLKTVGNIYVVIK